MKDYIKNHQLTIVSNVASKWGLAHKCYAELVTMYEEYASYGIQVVVFPSDQFLGMEHNKTEEIIEYARKKMGATFPVMEKCLVNGE